MSKEKLSKTFRKPGGLMLKSYKNTTTLGPWKQNVRKGTGAQDLYTILHVCMMNTVFNKF